MNKEEKPQIVPTGLLKNLKVSEIKPSQNNPRQLFDPVPLAELKESISQHGVLVPITVYKLKGQEKFGILDGERRYTCCLALEEEGKEISIPANIVEAPTKIAGLIYMFSIHNFREQWELMPTAISLASVMEELKETDSKKLSKLTGLSEGSVENCKTLLSFPEKFQKLSLLDDPKERIPSNFWIEASPVIKIYEDKLSSFVKELGRNALIDKLIQKYRDKKIASVIHFRRIIEAERRSAEKGITDVFVKHLRKYIENPNLETRDVFDEFIPTRNIRSAETTCDDFIEKIKSLETELITEGNKDLIGKFMKIQEYLSVLIEKIKGGN